MKLCDILNEDSDQALHAYTRGDKRGEIGNNINIVGSGADAVVYSRTDKPNIKKVTSPNRVSGKDPYELYAKIAGSKYTENPFLPRVFKNMKHSVSKDRFDYEVKMADNDDDPFYHHPADEVEIAEYTLEELIPLNSADGMEIASAWRNTFNDDVPAGKLKDVANIITVRMRSMVVDGTSSQYVKRFHQPKQIIQACNIVNSVKKHTDSEFDLHSGNFMLRRTNYGMQIVITDPLVSV